MQIVYYGYKIDMADRKVGPIVMNPYAFKKKGWEFYGVKDARKSPM